MYFGFRTTQGNQENEIWKKTEETLETHDPTFMDQRDRSLNEKV